MKRSHALLLCAVGWLGLAGFAGYETWAVTRLRAEIEAQREKSATLRAELQRLKSEAATSVQDLAQAERQLAELTAVQGAGARAQARQKEFAGWLARVKQLKQHFETTPGDRIPEMRFLTDQDWLRVARSADLDSDEGRSLARAAVRNAAAQFYANMLSKALKAFAKNSTTDTPPDIFALSAHLGDGADPLLLSRYEMTTAKDRSPQGRFEWRVQTKAVLDYENDWRVTVTSDAKGLGGGYSTSTGPFAWIPDFPARATRAQKDYAAAQNGAEATSLIDVLPYFTPPLSPEAIAALKKQEAKRKK